MAKYSGQEILESLIYSGQRDFNRLFLGFWKMIKYSKYQSFHTEKKCFIYCKLLFKKSIAFTYGCLKDIFQIQWKYHSWCRETFSLLTKLMLNNLKIKTNMNFLDIILRRKIIKSSNTEWMVFTDKENI